MQLCPTGLDETEDAKRQLGIHLQNALFCRNCEIYCTDADMCPRCGFLLYPIGTKPLPSKAKYVK